MAQHPSGVGELRRRRYPGAGSACLEPQQGFRVAAIDELAFGVSAGQVVDHLIVDLEVREGMVSAIEQFVSAVDLVAIFQRLRTMGHGIYINLVERHLRRI